MNSVFLEGFPGTAGGVMSQNLAVLPEGFELPPIEYLGSLLIGVIAISTVLIYLKPEVDESIVVGFGPWIVVGATLRVIHRLGLLPDSIEPLFGTPAVYLTVFIAAGITWAVSYKLGSQTGTLVALNGSIVSVMLISATIFHASGNESLRVYWPLLGTVIGGGIAGLAWLVLGRFKPKTIVTTGGVGGMVLLGHSLDAVSTAVGVDVIPGVRETTPASRAIIDFASTLPTSSMIGDGWLFVVVKVVLATAIVWLFTDFVREKPGQGLILLGAIAAVGLGPGVHNILLFMVTGQP